jgi:uncharacterized protein YacL
MTGKSLKELAVAIVIVVLIVTVVLNLLRHIAVLVVQTIFLNYFGFRIHKPKQDDIVHAWQAKVATPRNAK